MHVLPTVVRVAKARLPTSFGDFSIFGYREADSQLEHAALVRGEPNAAAATLVRIHSECLTGESFGSLRCDCRSQLETAMQNISERGCGVVIYLRGQEGRGIGLINKIRAYELQDRGWNTATANHQLGFPSDSRNYGAAFSILRDLAVGSISLMTNNPDKVVAGERAGFSIERIPIVAKITRENRAYLEVKRTVFGHKE